MGGAKNNFGGAFAPPPPGAATGSHAFYIVHEAMNTCLTLVSGCLRPGLDVEHFMRQT